MKIIQTLLQKLSRFGEFFRYISGCACSLLIKISFTTLLSLLGVPIWLSYLLTHMLLVFCAFFFHYLITFQRRFEGVKKTIIDFCRFTATVIFFKILDYIIVVGGIANLEKKLFSIQTPELQRQLFHAVMIVFSSGVIFLLRYFCYRALFRKKNREKAQ